MECYKAPLGSIGGGSTGTPATCSSFLLVPSGNGLVLSLRRDPRLKVKEEKVNADYFARICAGVDAGDFHIAVDGAWNDLHALEVAGKDHDVTASSVGLEREAKKTHQVNGTPYSPLYSGPCIM